jgi:hypothetical protein
MSLETGALSVMMMLMLDGFLDTLIMLVMLTFGASSGSPVMNESAGC